MLLKGFIVSILLLGIYNICLSQNNYFSRGVPACPYPISYTQPDGSSLTINLKGDKILNWAKTTDGYTVIKNEQGTFEYAKLSPDGDLINSGIQANDPENRKDLDNKFLSTTSKNLMFSKNQIKNANDKNIKKNTKQINTAFFPAIGTKNLLVIMVNFSNTTTTYTQSQFNTYMNGTSTSFKKYYLDNSYNKLTIVSTVTAWVNVSNTHDYYGQDDTHTAQLVRDAITAAKNANSSLDFSIFDNDGDNVVDNVAIIHQGLGQETTSNAYDIWSHSSDMSYYYSLTYNGVYFGPYITIPEKYSSSIMSKIGVLCHEFGHALGLPDTYDTDYSCSGLGEWDLMAGGEWLGMGAKPCNNTCWSKIKLQWITPVTISSPQTDTLRNPYTYGDCFKIMTTTSNQYFLLENRQNTGWDYYAPGHGMLIYHIDGTYINNHFNTNDINDSDAHQGIDIEEADGTLTTANDGDSGDPFPGTSSKTSFTDATTPNSKSWTSQLTSKPITYITENTSTDIITFKFTGGGTTEIDNSNIIKSDGLYIYPNPSNGIINIKINDILTQKVSIKIYNLLGTLVYENIENIENADNNDFNKTIDLSLLNKGIYFFIIENGLNTYKNKIILE